VGTVDASQGLVVQPACHFTHNAKILHEHFSSAASAAKSLHMTQASSSSRPPAPRPLLAALAEAPELLEDLSDWLVLSSSNGSVEDANVAPAAALAGWWQRTFQGEQGSTPPFLLDHPKGSAEARLRRGETVRSSGWLLDADAPRAVEVVSVPLPPPARTDESGPDLPTRCKDEDQVDSDGSEPSPSPARGRVLSLVRTGDPIRDGARPEETLLTTVGHEIAIALGALSNALELQPDTPPPSMTSHRGRLLSAATATVDQLRRALYWMREATDSERDRQLVPLPLLAAQLERWLPARGPWPEVRIKLRNIHHWTAAADAEELAAVPARRTQGLLEHAAEAMDRWNPQAAWLEVLMEATPGPDPRLRMAFTAPGPPVGDPEEAEMGAALANSRSLLYSLGGFDAFGSDSKSGSTAGSMLHWQLSLPTRIWTRGAEVEAATAHQPNRTTS